MDMSGLLPVLILYFLKGLVWFDWIVLKFVSPLGVDLLGGCEYSNHTRVRTKQPYRDPAEEVVF